MSFTHPGRVHGRNTRTHKGGRRCAYLIKFAAALVCAAFLPSAAYAQAALAGVVRDTSGAVLPGVTVEAASPALIEKVRTS